MLRMIIFFLFYFLSFFIPTDQIAAPEIYWAGILSIVLLIQKNTLSKPDVISKTVSTLWLASLCVIALNLLYSRSAAATLLSLVRYAEGYAAFLVGVSWSQEKIRWIRIFRTYAAITICIFILGACLSIITRLLPPYTGMFTVNGHHPFAAFLLLFFPFAILSKRTHIVSNIEKIITIVGILVSSARLTWAIAGVFIWIHRRTVGLKRIPLILSIVGVLLCGIILSSAPPYMRYIPFSSSPVAQRYIKDLHINLRGEYIVQTLRSIKDSPIIGHGSGTFSLLSRQFASKPGLFARYAHSFPLETVSEHGLIGGLPIILLLLWTGTLAVRSIRTHKKHPEISWAIILTLTYSIADTNMNILPIWILFWMLTGLVHPPVKLQGLRYKMQIYGCVLFLGSICITGIVSMIMSLSGKPYESFIMAPYRKTAAMAAIRDIYDRNTLPVLQWWYKKDPDIYAGMDIYTQHFIQSALAYDPHNAHYLQQYLTRAVRTGKQDIIGAFLCNPGHSMTQSHGCTAHVNKTAANLMTYKTETLSALSHLQGNDGISKTLYFLGLSVYTTTHDVPAAIYLLEQARDNAPDWGYYHVALSSAQFLWEHNERAAMQTLTACKNHPVASVGCSDTHPDSLFPPESYGSDIARIPEIQ